MSVNHLYLFLLLLCVPEVLRPNYDQISTLKFMKRLVLMCASLLLLAGCGQSDQAKAEELVTKSCKAFDQSPSIVESYIREAVALDEKYRPYLIAWLNWRMYFDEASLATTYKDMEIALKESKKYFPIQDSYCQTVRN